MHLLVAERKNKAGGHCPTCFILIFYRVNSSHMVESHTVDSHTVGIHSMDSYMDNSLHTDNCIPEIMYYRANYRQSLQEMDPRFQIQSHRTQILSVDDDCMVDSFSSPLSSTSYSYRKECEGSFAQHPIETIKTAKKCCLLPFVQLMLPMYEPLHP